VVAPGDPEELGEPDGLGAPDEAGGLGVPVGLGAAVGVGDAVGEGVGEGAGEDGAVGLGVVLMTLAPVWWAGIQTESLLKPDLGSSTWYRWPPAVLAGRVKTARRPAPRGLRAIVVQVPPTRSRRATVAPGLLNGAATWRRSAALPATSQSVSGACTVTVIAALCAPPGPASRKSSSAVGGCTERLTRPSGPVTPLTASRQPDVPCARSSRRTGSPAAGRPSCVTFPVNFAMAPVGNWTRATFSLTT
jgi:hypothetical protein